MKATATVRTSEAAGLATRMAKHFAHKVDVETTNGKTLIRLPTGECELDPAGETLELRAAAADDAGLARVQEVIGSHLARFAREEPIALTWNLCGGRSMVEDPPVVRGMRHATEQEG